MDNKQIKCNNCQKDFSKRDVYQAGKGKKLLCRECCRQTVKNCSWCQSKTEGWFVCWKQAITKEAPDRSIITIEMGEYNLFCSDNCRMTHKENTPEKLAEQQKRQELLDKGYKPCNWNLIPFEPLKIDCNNLIPPGEKYCESCQKKEKEVEENIKKREREDPAFRRRREENEKKCQKAQNWWNSLSKEEKLQEIKKIEQEWIKKAGGDNFHGYMGDGSCESRIEFKNGSLHVYPEDLSKIPPPFLEKFGVNVIPSHSKKIFPSGGSHSDNLQDQIGNLEKKLQHAKQSGDKSEINKLEQEIKDLKSRQKNSPSSSQPQNTSYWPWIVGISVVSLIILGFWVVKMRKYKNKKVKK